MKKQKNIAYTETERKLSPWRVMLALIMLGGIYSSSMFGWKWWSDVQNASSHEPWFAGYVDVTATPTYDFEQLGATSTPYAVLSFIVSSHDDPCVPTWGGVYNYDDAMKNIDLDRRIARLKQQKGNIAISFGGLLNDELAVKCTDHQKLYNAYRSVLERYEVNTIDLDLENEGLTDTIAGKRRAQVIAKLQKDRRSQGKSLAVWVTLPVAPQGLTKDGANAVSQLLQNGVDLAGVNVMTMNYSSSRAENDSMADASIKALKETHRQLGVLYERAGVYLQSATLWTKIGATPMIGQNDVQADNFTLEDAIKFNEFAKARGVGRMSLWSINRDVPCGENYVDTTKVSDSCSGNKNEKLAYSVALSEGFDGDLALNAGVVTKKEAKPVVKDDPEKSPYQIWKKTGAYLQGTKVVWHGNVYEAKWWTQGEVPDNPVLQSWETPWQLVGPVLPNDKPIPQATLPKGTYPEWSGTDEYETGDRVLFDGVPYQSKWWTQGDSPAAATSNADSSPWVPLTQTQINEIVENKSAEDTK